MLMWSLLLPWPSRRHHARELFYARTQGLCPSLVLPLPHLCHTFVLMSPKDARLVSKCSCVRTQVSGTQAFVGLEPVKMPYQNAGVRGSAVNDLVLGSCFSRAFASYVVAWCRSHPF